MQKNIQKNTQKKILITGATDGIGLETAKVLAQQGHHVLIHGRNQKKLERVQKELQLLANNNEAINSYQCDLSSIKQVNIFSEKIIKEHSTLDVLINNAGILRTENTRTEDNLDIRFAVNTLAPYLLTKQLLPIIPSDGRVVNLSSAAQASINFDALKGNVELEAMQAYSQSKLAITSWSHFMAEEYKDSGPIIVAINPGSLLATNMVKEGFGIAGSDINVGVDILVRAALSNEFSEASGLYFDNDAGKFNQAHADVYDSTNATDIINAIEDILARLVH